MAIGWFICPYKRKPDPTRMIRYCAMDDFTAQIRADGGNWSETEVLGDCAVVKVNASNATLNAVAGTPGFVRIPVARLGDSLSSLTTAQRAGLHTRIEAMGYPLAEIEAALGPDLGLKTLGDVLRLVTRRRLRPRYDAETDRLIWDGPIQPVRPIEDVDRAVR
jgi:hypothetical protein